LLRKGLATTILAAAETPAASSGGGEGRGKSEEACAGGWGLPPVSPQARATRGLDSEHYLNFYHGLGNGF